MKEMGTLENKADTWINLTPQAVKRITNYCCEDASFGPKMASEASNFVGGHTPRPSYPSISSVFCSL